MPDTDVKKAMELLKKAHDLLKCSDIDNLKRSADYLEESIQWLNKKSPENVGLRH